MSHLIDRYLVAVLERLPTGQRQEVGAELRTLIGDMVDTKVAAGMEPGGATREVLTELGDPSRLARSYDQRPQYLIGPAWFPSYFDLLKVIVPAVSLILAALAFAGALVDDQTVATAIGRGLGAGLEIAIQATFWLTLTFALIERFSDSTPETDASWTVDSLPQQRTGRQIGLATTVFDVAVSVVFGAVAIVQARSGVGAFVRGLDDRSWSDLPLFNPDLPGWVPVAFFALVLGAIASAILRYRVGSWTPAMLRLAVAEAALWIGFVVVVALSWPIINPALGMEIDPGGSWWETGGQANLLLIVVIVLVSASDLWDAWKGYREAQAEAAAGATPA